MSYLYSKLQLKFSTSCKMLTFLKYYFLLLFVSTPYCNFELQNLISSDYKHTVHHWHACTLLLCMSFIKWYSAEHILRQFGYGQYVLQTLICLDYPHCGDHKCVGVDWQGERAWWAILWWSRAHYLDGWTSNTHLDHVASILYYMRYWYIVCNVLYVATCAIQQILVLQILTNLKGWQTIEILWLEQ